MQSVKIILKDVSKTFINRDKQAAPVLQNISFEIFKSEFFCLLGPSGCGKTTIINLIAGFIFPERGQVLIDGQALTKPNHQRTVVFQEHGLFPWKTVRENIEFGLICQGLKSKNRQLISDKLIAKIHLAGFENYFPHQLSVGMKQRVAIARALAVKPQIILMDEPFASVDALTRDFLQEELLRWQTELGLTVVFVTHNIDEAIFLGDRIAILSHQPARVKQILAVPLHKPRLSEVKNSPDFFKLRTQIWYSLREELINLKLNYSSV